MVNVRFMLQIQIPVVAGDIVEARAKAKEILALSDTEDKCTFLQVVPVGNDPKSKG